MLLICPTEDYASGWLLFRDPCWAGGACGAAASTQTTGTFIGAFSRSFCTAATSDMRQYAACASPADRRGAGGGGGVIAAEDLRQALKAEVIFIALWDAAKYT